MDPVDTYAKLKSDIRALEEQAAALRATFLRPGARLRSNRYEVIIRLQTRRTFQKDLLPAEVLNDPRYWVETSSEVVLVHSLETQPKALKNNDEIIMVERF